MILIKIFSHNGKYTDFIEDYWADILPRKGDILSITIKGCSEVFTVDHIAQIIEPMEKGNLNNRLSHVEVFVRKYISEIDGEY